MVGIAVLGAIGGVAALRATCDTDAPTSQLVIEPEEAPADRFFNLSEEDFDGLPTRVQNMLTDARATDESVVLLWEFEFDEAVRTFTSLSENQTGDQHVSTFRWDGQFYRYRIVDILRAHPLWC